MTTKADLQAWYTQGAPLIAAWPDPAPIPPSPNPPGGGGVGLYTEYCNPFLGAKTYYVKNVNADGSAIPGAGQAVACVVDQSSPTAGRVVWGAVAESHAIINGWEVWEGAQTLPSGPFYPMEQVSCQWIDVIAGTSQDVTGAIGAGPVGACMHPLLVPLTGHCRIVQYGWAWSAPPPSGARSGPFYWQADYFYGLLTTDNAWGDPTTKTRQIIREQEAWWDASGTWVRGAGTQAPWVLTNGVWTMQNPGPITYAGFEEMGRGLGIMWAYQFPDYRAALSAAM